MATAEEKVGTVSALGVRALLAYARRRGVDVDALARQLGQSDHGAQDPEGRISVVDNRRLWALVAARSGDPAFGLHFAQQLEVGTFEALDYAMWASATLADAIERIVRFHRLIGDDLLLRVVQRGGTARLVRECLHDVAPRAESFVTFLVARARSLVAKLPDPREVRFRHPPPRDLRPYRAFFRCPVRFDASTTELVTDAQALQLPLRSARPGLAAVLDRHMRDLLARLPTSDHFEQRVHDAIARSLHGSRPSLAATARQLHASPRTVQRRLRERGMSHRDLVEEIRRDLAERLLARPRLSIAEIAYLLGFDNASGFRKAYKRWHGVAPSERRSRR